ncbi:hypothetical protein [Thiocapsa bogorovii]|uniref:hypothetical protein n=1 Tax=Thiocapsa bogorovii TaxID=521689 RepID=UPI001E2A9A16|nr:hypothetical protein [Thiocapsa bogorovii]UHD15019.1 hypothetical protein LT988_17260 [Thiocapsa bogorovii]
MMKLPLIVGLSFATFEGFAICTPDPPEIGDIGPVSELVCRDLKQRFPDSTTAVENRTIRSPERVEILVSVDGEPMVLGYELDGFVWEAMPSQEGSEEGYASVERSGR